LMLGACLALSASCFVRSALGESEPESPSSSEDRAEQRTDDTPLPSFDPKLTAKLLELQATRRAARRTALEDPKRWDEERSQRASEHRAQLVALWGTLVGSIDGQAHLRLHADRMARLNRMLDLAEQKKHPALVKRIRSDIERELTHHARVMLQLRAAMGMR